MSLSDPVLTNLDHHGLLPFGTPEFLQNGAWMAWIQFSFALDLDKWHQKSLSGLCCLGPTPMA